MNILLAFIEHKLIDKATADTLADILGGEYIELLTLFVRELSTHSLALQAATTAKDNQEIYRITHTLKGMAGNLGLTDFAEACQTIEESSRMGNITHYDHFLNEFFRQKANILHAFPSQSVESQ